MNKAAKTKTKTKIKPQTFDFPTISVVDRRGLDDLILTDEGRRRIIIRSKY